MRASNAVVSGSGDGNNAGQRIVVKANDRTEVRFPVTTDRTGTARFQFAVTSGSYSDAAEISLPVWTPATTEAFATYGSTDKNGAIIQPVQTPGDVWPQFGGLEVTTSSTQLQELLDLKHALNLAEARANPAGLKQRVVIKKPVGGAKEAHSRFTVSFSQKRRGVMASTSDCTLRI